MAGSRPVFYDTGALQKLVKKQREESLYCSHTDKVTIQAERYFVYIGELHDCTKYINAKPRSMENVNVDTLIYASALILNEVIPDVHINTFINFCKHYGIPVVWIHSHLTPGNWMWSYKLCFIGKISNIQILQKLIPVLK